MSRKFQSFETVQDFNTKHVELFILFLFKLKSQRNHSRAPEFGVLNENIVGRDRHRFGDISRIFREVINITNDFLGYLPLGKLNFGRKPQ